MRRKLFIAMVILLLTTGTATAVDQFFVYSHCASGCTGTGLTTTSTQVNFGIRADTVLVRNDNAAAGADIFIDWVGGTATGADFRLPAGASITLHGRAWGRVSLACSTGTCLMMLLAVN